MSDSGLFQRTFPDGIVKGEPIEERFRAALHKNSGKPVDEEAAVRLMEEIGEDESMLLDFVQSPAFPQFFGMAMPLLKYGLPIKPVQLDNVRRFAGYLDDISFLVLSFEYIKPEAPDVNTALISWVKQGGTLLYIGDGSDPFHGIDSWWRKSGYENPAQHLFEMAGLSRSLADGRYQVDKGEIIVWNMMPAKICLKAELADSYRALVKDALAGRGTDWQYRNDLTLHRGPYIISAVMDESVNDDRKVFDGLYADLLENDYKIIAHKEIAPDESALLFDFAKIAGEEFRIVGTSARVERAGLEEDALRMRLKTADKIKAFTRVRLPKPVGQVSALDEDGDSVPVSMEWDQGSRTLLVSYDSQAKAVDVTAAWA